MERVKWQETVQLSPHRSRIPHPTPLEKPILGIFMSSIHLAPKVRVAPYEILFFNSF